MHIQRFNGEGDEYSKAYPYKYGNQERYTIF